MSTDDDAVVQWRTLEGEVARLWELKVDEPFSDDETLRQETLVQVGRDDDGEAFTLVQVSARSVDPALTGSVVYENDAPDIVPILVATVPCSDGRRRLTPDAWRLSRNDERRFAQLIADRERHLPVLLFTTDPTFGTEAADRVARTLAGLAHVVVNRARFPALVERTGIDAPTGANAYLWWAAPTGTVRRPSWFRGDDLAPSAWGTPAWPIVRRIFGTSAFRLAPPALASQLEAESTRRRLRALEERAASTEIDAEMLEAWEHDLVALERAQRDNAALELENERLQNDLNALLASFDLAVAEAAGHTTDQHASDEAAPATLAEAVKLADQRCDHLIFLPDAFRSAEAWHYQRPQVVLDALLKLDALAGQWLSDQLTGSFTLAARARGLPWKPAISRTAQTQYRADYTKHYDGQEVLLGPHLAWGNSPDNAVRVYLYLDRDRRTVVVGHVGRHLRDTSNPHL